MTDGTFLRELVLLQTILLRMLYRLLRSNLVNNPPGITASPAIRCTIFCVLMAIFSSHLMQHHLNSAYLEIGYVLVLTQVFFNKPKDLSKLGRFSSKIPSG